MKGAFTNLDAVDVLPEEGGGIGAEEERTSQRILRQLKPLKDLAADEADASGERDHSAD